MHELRVLLHVLGARGLPLLGCVLEALDLESHRLRQLIHAVRLAAEELHAGLDLDAAPRGALGLLRGGDQRDVVLAGEVQHPLHVRHEWLRAFFHLVDLHDAAAKLQHCRGGRRLGPRHHAVRAVQRHVQVAPVIDLAVDNALPEAAAKRERCAARCRQNRLDKLGLPGGGRALGLDTSDGGFDIQAGLVQGTRQVQPRRHAGEGPREARRHGAVRLALGRRADARGLLEARREARQQRAHEVARDAHQQRAGALALRLHGQSALALEVDLEPRR
mmetsp:Transcript_67246/g.217004  ORF Transcript_67246/g.217004 Transcript_67246/m.217004 type:complete len:275 (-) Transcript_67246:1444-2268(-)